MSKEIKTLMEGKREQHWTQRGLCRGDDRFTGKFEWLSASDILDMAELCGLCPVFWECDAWASDPEKVFDVFAAGRWIHGESDDDSG